MANAVDVFSIKCNAPQDITNGKTESHQGQVLEGMSLPLRSVKFMFNSKRYMAVAEFTKAYTRKVCE